VNKMQTRFKKGIDMKIGLKRYARTFLVVALLSSYCAIAAEPWKDLFDGKTLNGWEQKGGQAKYTVEDGQIVGRTVLNTDNSFLCTKQFYSDFILEVDFKVDPQLNSGVQIRSNSFPEYKAEW